LELGDLDAAQFRAWGATLGELHAALKDYPGAAATARNTWRDHLASAKEYIPEGESALRDEWDRIASVLPALPVNRDTYGLIHFDFELDNLCWRDRAVGMLDFDDCARYWYVADIAFALRDLFDAGADLDHPSFREFARGYGAHHPLDSALLEQIPLFLSMSKLLIYARLARATDLPADREYPEWLAELHRKFHNRMEAYKTSLEGHRG
jgi:Ser/Thr protein kinase RdoA (MazF antagonist)